jgi:dihydroorotate dehydrogenase
MLQPIIISAPFGNWIQPKGCTPTLGTFTKKYRGGIPTRLWRMLTSLRPVIRSGAWINKMRLPNPGLNSLIKGFVKNQNAYSDSIISIHGFDGEEWADLLGLAFSLHPLAIELNISCPNVEAVTLNGVNELAGVIKQFYDNIPTTFNYCPLIAKLPPIRWMTYAQPLWDVGVTHFHACNTIWTPGGGMSGKPLMPYSLWAVEELCYVFPGATVIGGGGVTCYNDVLRYRSAGAKHVAVGGHLFNPLTWSKVGKWAN